MDNNCIDGLDLHRKHNGKYNTAIDVGVCWGEYSNTYCKLFDNVIGFEPNWNSKVQNSIQEIKNKNKNFICFQHGLGRYDQENVEFWSCSRPGLSSYSLEHIKIIQKNSWGLQHAKNIEYEIGNTTVKKLDTVVELYFFNRSIDFIKIDAEGATLDILYGGINTIQKHKPNIQTEKEVYVEERTKISDFMKKQQYQQHKLDNDFFWAHKDNL